MICANTDTHGSPKVHRVSVIKCNYIVSSNTMYYHTVQFACCFGALYLSRMHSHHNIPSDHMARFNQLAKKLVLCVDIELVKLSVWPEASAIANSLSRLLAVASRCRSPENQMVLSRDRIAFGDLPLH